MSNMADIREENQDAIASFDEKGLATGYATKPEGGDQGNNNDKEAGPSNMVSRARQSLSDLFTIVAHPKYITRYDISANVV